jgi:hypothetical protein
MSHGPASALPDMFGTIAQRLSGSETKPGGLSNVTAEREVFN